MPPQYFLSQKGILFTALFTITNNYFMGKLMELGSVYHLYDHAVDKNNVFANEGNFSYFLERYEHFLTPVVNTMAFCLMPNHFHIAIQVKRPPIILQAAPQLLESWKLSKSSTDDDFQRRVSRQFGNFFSSYTQAFNKQQNRRGALFEGTFCRKLVPDRTYFKNLICYIHHNPVKHGFCAHYQEWLFSSYNTLIMEDEPTFLERQSLFKAFDGRATFIRDHDNWKQAPLD